MPKQRMSQPAKKKADLSNREGADADMQRENTRRESQGGMHERRGAEEEQAPQWRREGEGGQNE